MSWCLWMVLLCESFATTMLKEISDFNLLYMVNVGHLGLVLREIHKITLNSMSHFIDGLFSVNYFSCINKACKTNSGF